MTTLQDLLIYKSIVGEGGGSQITVEPLNATENGIYNAGSGKAYNPVSVDVPEPTLISKSINENGTYNASSDNADGYSSVTVNVSADMSVNDNQFKALVDITNLTKNGSISYCQTVANGVSVDWGDGSPAETSSLTGLNNGTCAYLTHNYQNEGRYVITLTCNEGDFSVLGRNGRGSGVYYPQTRLGYSTPNCSFDPFNSRVIEISVGKNFKLFIQGQDTTCCFTYLMGLKKVNGTVNLVAASASPCIYIQGCYSLSTININYDGLSGWITSMGDNPSLTGTISIPSAVTKIDNQCFRNDYYINTFDFTDFTLVDGALPITFGTNVFMNTNPSMSILFATQEIAEVAKQTTNLTAYANYIHYVGE